MVHIIHVVLILLEQRWEDLNMSFHVLSGLSPLFFSIQNELKAEYVLKIKPEVCLALFSTESNLMVNLVMSYSTDGDVIYVIF